MQVLRSLGSCCHLYRGPRHSLLSPKSQPRAALGIRVSSEKDKTRHRARPCQNTEPHTSREDLPLVISHTPLRKEGTASPSWTPLYKKVSDGGLPWWSRGFRIRLADGGLPWWSRGFRIRLAAQGTQVPFLVQGDPTCQGATKPMRHNS